MIDARSALAPSLTKKVCAFGVDTRLDEVAQEGLYHLGVFGCAVTPARRIPFDGDHSELERSELTLQFQIS